MDAIDRHIIKLLQENARISLKTMAEKTFLSSPAVSARIDRLEREGIITGYHAVVDPMKLGYHILAYINLNVQPEDKAKFYAYAEEMPNVLECSCVTGEYSMIMKVAFSSTMELDQFIGTAAEIRENQYPDRIFHPRRSQRSGCRSGNGIIFPETAGNGAHIL